MKVGLVTFSDPRPAKYVKEREDFLKRKHNNLKNYIERLGYEVLDHRFILQKEPLFGISAYQHVDKIGHYLSSQEVEAVIIGAWHWAVPEMSVRLVKNLKVPVCLYTDLDPSWAGLTYFGAVGASLWESLDPFAQTHFRAYDLGELERWLRAVKAYSIVKNSTLLLYGSSYCLDMPHLRDDYERLKDIFVKDVLEEDQLELYIKAEKISLQRISRFIHWLQREGAEIELDHKMATKEVLEKEVALYLAAKDRVENDDTITGISIKCQPAFSEIIGVTPCLIPAFMPFHRDAEGIKRVIPTVCEGDVKGLISSVIAYGLNPLDPPLFGDIKVLNKGYVIISNCGGSSIWWAAACRECSLKQFMSKIYLRPQCQGKGGLAVGYLLKREVPVTVLRLYRRGNKYVLQFFETKTVPIRTSILKSIRWGEMWPHVAVKINGPASFLKSVSSNHYVVVHGNFAFEMRLLGKLFGIEVEEMEV